MLRKKNGVYDVHYYEKFVGEDYDPNSDFLITVTGCSCSDGQYFSNIKDIWPNKFKELFTNNYNMNVNLLNYSNAGVSNNYISRVTMEYNIDKKPNLAIISFTEFQRHEIHTDTETYCTAYWVNSNLSDAYYIDYDEEFGIINFLQNMIILQNYFNFRKIPYIFSFAYPKYHYFWIKEKYIRYNSSHIVKKLLSMIDETKILMPTICGPNHIDWCFFDKAEDNHHPGPINHSVFARKLFEFYENNKDIL
jgi:hypothetical protein